MNKKILSTAIIACLLVSTTSSVQAFGFKKKNKNTTVQSTKVGKTVNKKEKKDQTEAQAPYTNEVHSVFSLKDCIEISIKYNPEIQASIYNEDIYKTKIVQAWANFFPEITAGIQGSRSGNKYTGDVPVYMGNQYVTMGYIPSVSVDMMLFDFGKTKAFADKAKSMYEGAKEDTKENINSIIYSIKSAYFNILFAQAQVKVYEDTVADYELQLSQAQGFYRYGTKAKIDVVTAEYNLGKAKLNLVKARNVLEVAKVQLSKIMGVPEYTNYELSDQLTLNVLDINEDDALKTAFEVRPELISARKNVEAAKMNLRAARREFTPNLGVFAEYDNGIGNKYNVQSAQVGLGLSYTGLNVLKIKKQVDEANASYKKTKAKYENTKNNVYYNVKKNYMNLQTNMEAIVIAKLALDEAKEQYRQVTGRYKAGVGDAIELKDGENTYLNARLDFYNAMLNYNVTAAELEKEVGIPLVFTNKKVIEIKAEDL